MNLGNRNVTSGAARVIITEGPRGVPAEASSAPQVDYKVFLKGVAEDVPDSIVESILMELGPIKYFRRMLTQKSEPTSSATCEFASARGLVNCIRILDNFKFSNKNIEVIAGQKAKSGAAEFVEELKARLGKGQSNPNEDEVNELVKKELSKDDEGIKERIRLLADGFENNRSKIVKEEKKTGRKLYTEEKLNFHKQRYGILNKAELDELFVREMKIWMEEDAQHAAQRDRALEAEKKAYQRKRALLEAELEGRRVSTPHSSRSQRLALLSEDLYYSGCYDIMEFLDLKRPPSPESSSRKGEKSEKNDKNERQEPKKAPDNDPSLLAKRAAPGSPAWPLAIEAPSKSEEFFANPANAGLVKEKILTEMKKQELFKDSSKLKFLINLRKAIPTSTREIFDLNIRWETLEKVA